MTRRFWTRGEAGRLLAEALEEYQGLENVVVLALPRGGVPVGYEVARALGAPLDVLVVRKLGVPGQPEFAFGAIASGGARVLNPDVVRLLDLPEALMDRVAAAEQVELDRREQAYRGGRPPPRVRGRTVILVDDGVAAGATMRTAVAAVRRLGARRVVAAAPVASAEAYRLLAGEADRVVCLTTPDPFYAVAAWYDQFPQVSDAEVRDLLESGGAGARARAWRPTYEADPQPT
jgi:putative phosphoribosyl transferase